MSRHDTLGKLATTVAEVGNQTIVTFHETAVVIFDNMEIRLDNGGWKTATTKVRMNQAARQFALGYSVYQEKGKWYAQIGAYPPVEFIDGKAVLPRN